MRSPCAGAALDPPLWIIVPNKALSFSISLLLFTVVPNKALSLSLSLSLSLPLSLSLSLPPPPSSLDLSVCVECLIGKQKKPILFKVTVTVTALEP